MRPQIYHARNLNSTEVRMLFVAIS